MYNGQKISFLRVTKSSLGQNKKKPQLSIFGTNMKKTLKLWLTDMKGNPQHIMFIDENMRKNLNF